MAASEHGEQRAGKEPNIAKRFPRWTASVGRWAREELVSSVIRASMVFAIGLAANHYDDQIARFATEAFYSYRFLVLVGAIACVVVFYNMRKHWKKSYGMVEVILGFVALLAFMNRNATPVLEEWIAGFAAPIYIIIRGFDNIYGKQN